MTGNKILDNILGALFLLASATTLCTIIYTQHVFMRTLPENNKEFQSFKEHAKNYSTNDYYRLDKLIINLPSKTSRSRFFEVQANLVPFLSENIRDLEAHKAILQDIVIDIASRIPPRELASISGKILLKSRLKKRMNNLFGRAFVKKIYFTRFVIQ